MGRAYELYPVVEEEIEESVIGAGRNSSLQSSESESCI